MSKPPPRKPAADGPVWLYGRHAVLAALQNPARHQHKLMATKNALDWLADHGRTIPIEPVKPDVIDRELHAGAVHQGVAIKVSPLSPPDLSDVLSHPGPIIVLDQVTDPQNIGAICRLAAAFGAAAVVSQDRRTPPLSGALAKAAVGAIEVVPFVRVVNIARSLEAMKDEGRTVLGLASEGADDLPTVAVSGPVALVLGAEGAGLRELVRTTCDQLIRIPIAPAVESLNVATATAIALYALKP